jgi:outer membrane phospholipase A
MNKLLILHSLLLCLILGLTVRSIYGQKVDEGSNEKSSKFVSSFGFHDPIFIAFGKINTSASYDNTKYANFQVSFLYELLNFHKGEKDAKKPSRGVNLGYTQDSFWYFSLVNGSYFESSFKPSLVILYQYIGKNNIPWVHRIDLEAGYQHHSNGKKSLDSRSTEYIYMKPTIVWEILKSSYLFVSPKIWGYFRLPNNNKDIAEYWGYLDLELTWRTGFGLQIETHTQPASRCVSFNTVLTYPLNNICKLFNFYFLIDYRKGAGVTFLSYKEQSSSLLFGIAVSR